NRDGRIDSFHFVQCSFPFFVLLTRRAGGAAILIIARTGVPVTSWTLPHLTPETLLDFMRNPVKRLRTIN
ncbi:MAG: hypothetical protein COW41_03280, partial [Deltaproteobacteria bacterium CG17_big_fil_post_rev_8_21_14_2_50_51_6]